MNVSVSYRNILKNGWKVSGAGTGPPTCKMGTFFHIPLALTMAINNNFQLNEALGETPKLLVLRSSRTMKITFIVIPNVWEFN